MSWSFIEKLLDVGKVLYDNSTDHPVGIGVSGRACRSNLLHARYAAPDIRGRDRRRFCGVTGDGRDRVV